MEKDSRLTRRRFLKLALAGAGLALAPELVTQLHNLNVRFERSRRPKLLDTISPASVAFGSSPHYNSLEFLSRTGEAIGKQPHWVNLFAAGNRPLARDPQLLPEIRAAQNRGLRFILSWGMGIKFVNAAVLAEDLAVIEEPFYFRPWYEMNGVWTQDWYGQFTPGEFVSHWWQLRETFARVLPQAKFIFSPNATNVAPAFVEYFPGADYVDAVGLDVYHKYSYSPFNLRHYLFSDLSPEETLGPDIATIQDLAPQIPWLITEINASVEFGRARWLAEAVAYAVSAGAKAWLTFDWNKAQAAWDEYDWAIINHPELVQALRHELGRDYYLA